MKVAIIIVFLFLIHLPCFAQKNIPVIIDTDAGLDDFRAILLLQNIKGIDIKAITLSDGTLFPEKGAKRVYQLLKCLNKEDIFIGTGKKTMYSKPLWRAFAEQIPWNCCDKKYSDSLYTFPNATQVLNKIFDEANDKSVVVICLGSLSNLFETLKINPLAKNKIKEIIWYNSSNIEEGTNYTFAPQAADYILSHNIPIKLINSIANKRINYNFNFINQIAESKTNVSDCIKNQIKKIQALSQTSHLQCWDELCAIYFANPSIFTLKDFVKNPNIQFVIDYDTTKVKKTYLQLLKEYYIQNYGIVFSLFPQDSIYYFQDVNEIRNQAVEKYGIEEFKSIVLTSEIHNHLGIYSILGVKMALVAMQLLNAPKNKIKVISYAGNTPPLSCLNDGLMVTTGSTPAYNLFYVDTTSTPTCSAKFCYNNQCLQISLKKQIAEKIEQKIKETLIHFGISSDAYWNNIRQLTLHYWITLDRNQIFDIQ